MTTEQEVFDCAARGCGAAHYENELWLCADCGELFCEAHIADLLDENAALMKEDERGGSVYVCAECRARRMKKTAQGESGARKAVAA